MLPRGGRRGRFKRANYNNQAERMLARMRRPAIKHCWLRAAAGD